MPRLVNKNAILHRRWISYDLILFISQHETHTKRNHHQQLFPSGCTKKKTCVNWTQDTTHVNVAFLTTGKIRKEQSLQLFSQSHFSEKIMSSFNCIIWKWKNNLQSIWTRKAKRELEIWVQSYPREMRWRSDYDGCVCGPAHLTMKGFKVKIQIMRFHWSDLISHGREDYMFGKERLCFLFMSKQSHLTLSFHLHPLLSKPCWSRVNLKTIQIWNSPYSRIFALLGKPRVLSAWAPQLACFSRTYWYEVHVSVAPVVSDKDRRLHKLTRANFVFEVHSQRWDILFVSIRKTAFATKFYLRCNYSSRYKYSRLTPIAVNNCTSQILGRSNLADSQFLLHS